MNYDRLHSLQTSLQNSQTEENKNESVAAEAGLLIGHNGCVVQEVEEPQLRQVSRHDTDEGHGIWEFLGGRGAGAELEVVRVVGAGPIQWAWQRPSELA